MGLSPGDNLIVDDTKLTTKKDKSSRERNFWLREWTILLPISIDFRFNVPMKALRGPSKTPLVAHVGLAHVRLGHRLSIQRSSRKQHHQ